MVITVNTPYPSTHVKTCHIRKFRKICKIRRYIYRILTIFTNFAKNNLKHMTNTNKQYDDVIAQCREMFISKMGDYGPNWRILRPQTLTDQILIKAKRIRTIEINGESMVGEEIWPEFVGIINYGIMELIQLEKGYSEEVDMTREQVTLLYDRYINDTKTLMIAKNTDYGEAWRLMRDQSYTDMILSKLQRIKEIENNGGKTLVSEGIDANIQDIINYAVFALIKHNEREDALK